MIGIFFVMTFQQSLSLADQGVQRRNILNSIADDLPVGSNKTVLYVQSDSSFYGLPNDTKVLPFQIGPGKILALYLKDRVYIPQSVYLPDSFYKIDSQGYFQDQGGGWGYFRDYLDLLNSIKENKVDIKSVYSFNYFSKTKVIKNITPEVKQRLTSELGI